MKYDIQHPVRQFNMHDDPLTNIETIHLIIWTKGLCIAGFDANGELLTAKVYAHDDKGEQTIESVFINEPLVAGPQPVTHIWIADDRNILVPHKLFDANEAASWLKQFYFVEADENVRCSQLNGNIKAGIAFTSKGQTDELLDKYFKESRVGAVSETIISSQELKSATDAADITVLGDTIILSIFQGNQLLLHEVSQGKNIDDVVYTIASACLEYGIVQHKLRVSLSGLCIDADMIRSLSAYFPHMSVPGSEQYLSFTFLRKLIACA
jgi:hypothetical protein